MMLKGPQRCVTCPQKETDFGEPDGFLHRFPTDRHYCHLTDCEITNVVSDEFTFHHRCPLWINTEWPLHPH